MKFPLNEELVGSKIRIRVKWLDEGEIPSGYFFGLANQRNAKTLVSSVLTADEVEVFSLPEIIAAHESIYTNLFTEDEIDSKVQTDLLSFVTHCLSDEDRESSEGPVSLDEASEALDLSNQ